LLTERLIKERAFSAVTVEADWPDAYRANRYVRGRPGDADAVEALDSFKRFPTWMWRNTDVVEFVAWLRERNDALREGAQKAGFYGLDLYSLHSSVRAVLHFLDRVDPEAARLTDRLSRLATRVNEHFPKPSCVPRFHLSHFLASPIM
jgi:erythromycin esterase-like protein